MNALTETGLKLSLKPGNKALYDALMRAVSAIFHLNDAGSTAIDIDIRGGKPVLQVDRPPVFVRGVATVTQRVCGTRQRRMVASFHGAQIEWLERETPTPLGEMRCA